MLGFIPALCLNYEADVFSLIVAQCTLRSVFVAGQYRGRQQIPRETRLAKCRNILCPVTFRGARYAMVQDLEFDLFKMFNGGFDHPIRVGKLPPQVLRKLDWQCGEVYLHPQTAQKIKWHDQGRAIPYDPGPALLNAIAYGDIAQETDRDNSRDIIFMFQMVGYRKHIYVPCRLDHGHCGIFVRTMHHRHITNGKLRRFRMLETRSFEFKKAA